jgi:hypothetical protein
MGDRDERHEEERHIPRNEPDSQDEEYPFPIREYDKEYEIKNINPSIIPLYYGLPTKEPNNFLFEFELFCQTYKYKNYVKNIRLLPSNLKDDYLIWFMGLQG